MCDNKKDEQNNYKRKKLAIRRHLNNITNVVCLHIKNNTFLKMDKSTNLFYVYFMLGYVHIQTGQTLG